MRRSRDTTAAGELLGARLREVRLKRGLSQQALAELVGIPQTHVSAMELGAKFPNLMTILRLAQTPTTVARLFGRRLNPSLKAAAAISLSNSSGSTMTSRYYPAMSC